MKHRVINHSLQPQMLDSGLQLAAAGTPGSERAGVELSSRDRTRLVATGIVSIVAPGEEGPAVPRAVPAAEKPSRAPRPASKQD